MKCANHQLVVYSRWIGIVDCATICHDFQSNTRTLRTGADALLCQAGFLMRCGTHRIETLHNSHAFRISRRAKYVESGSNGWKCLFRSDMQQIASTILCVFYVVLFLELSDVGSHEREYRGFIIIKASLSVGSGQGGRVKVHRAKCLFIIDLLIV